MSREYNSAPYRCCAPLLLVCLIVAAIWTIRANTDPPASARGDANVGTSEAASFDDHHVDAKDPMRDNAETSGKRFNITNFPDEDFDLAWSAAIAQGGTESDRVWNLVLVVTKISKTGSPSLIIEKIREEFGPGKSRNMLVATLFTNSPMSENLTNVYRSLEFDDERKAAQSGTAKVIARLDSATDLNVEEYTFFGEDLSRVLAEGLDYYVCRFTRESKEVRSAKFQEAIDLAGSPDAQVLLISRLNTSLPFDCWETATTRGLEIPNSDREAIISKMIYEDSGRAMAMITSSENSDKYLASAMRNWLDLDARKPVEWFYEQSKSLSSAQQSRAIQGIVDFSTAHGELDAAGDWARQIPDEALQATLLLSIQKEAESLTNVKEQPEN